MKTEVAVSRSETRLRQYFETESETLLRTIRAYVYHATYLAQTPNEVEEISHEILSQVFIEAIEHSERFDPERPPRAWLLGIAANLIKQLLASNGRYAKRELTADEEDEEVFFDRITSFSISQLEDDVAVKDEVESLLSHLSPKEQDLVRIAMKHNFKGKAIAEEMGMTPGNARVKLHRVLHRLQEMIKR